MAINATLEKLPEWKITEIVANRRQILRLKCTKFTRAAYSTPQTSWI